MKTYTVTWTEEHCLEVEAHTPIGALSDAFEKRGAVGYVKTETCVRTQFIRCDLMAPRVVGHLSAEGQNTAPTMEPAPKEDF